MKRRVDVELTPMQCEWLAAFLDYLALEGRRAGADTGALLLFHPTPRKSLATAVREIARKARQRASEQRIQAERMKCTVQMLKEQAYCLAVLLGASDRWLNAIADPTSRQVAHRWMLPVEVELLTRGGRAGRPRTRGLEGGEVVPTPAWAKELLPKV